MITTQDIKVFLLKEIILLGAQRKGYDIHHPAARFCSNKISNLISDLNFMGYVDAI